MEKIKNNNKVEKIKLVCINDVDTMCNKMWVTKGVIYVGKIYDNGLVKIFENHEHIGYVQEYSVFYDSSFISLSKWREQQINSILDDSNL